MKKNLLFLMLIFLGMLPIFAQLVVKKHSLAERARQSDFVIEGKVIAKSCFWDTKKRLIWTKNTIKLSKVFKGQVAGQVFEIITPGGTVGEDIISLSHNTVFSEGTEGIFFCVFRELNGEKIVIPYYEHVYFHDDGVNAIATDEYDGYKNVEKEIYPAIEKETRYRKNIGANMFEAKRLANSGGIFIPDDVNTGFAIEYSFDNVAYTGANNQILAFDVYARSELSGIRLADLTLFIDYSAISFGANLVGNQKITATKGTMILGNAYTLTLADSTSDKLRIMVDAANGNPAALYQLTTQNEFLCHLEIDISAVTLPGGAMFNPANMQGRTEYYNNVNSSYQKYSTVKANDSLYSALNTNSSIGITLTMENGQYDNLQQKYTFDIYGFADAQNTQISAATVSINYNTTTFGNSVDASTNIQVYSAIPNLYPNYYTKKGDEDNDTFFAQLLNDSTFGFYVLPTTSSYLFTVELNVQNCATPVGLSFDVSLMTGYNVYYTGAVPLPKEDYNPIIATDFNNNIPCPGLSPYITYFTPQIITAGTQSILSIYGGNFGNTRGNIWFNDIDNMGSFMQAPDSAFQNLTWSDNFIQVYVPSINPNNRTAGTGRIIVQTAAPASLTDTSLIALDIDYAVTNYGYGDGSYRRYDLENDDNNGGYTFKIHDVLYTANTKPCVDYAFKEWVCKTYVNFKVGGTITNPLSQLNPNSQNIIYLADTTDPVFTSSNVLATTIRHDKQCSSSLEPYSQYMAEVDIAVRDGWLWHFDTTQVSLPPNAYDLTTVLIHELGHAHSIAHCGASVKRMYPHTTIGVAERHLHPSDSLAGISVMGHSSWLGLIGCTNSMIPLLCGLIDI